MYLQHNKNIPPHQLVEIPMRQNIPGEQNEDYLTTARRMGIPKRRNKSSSRWSDEPLPFGKSRVKKPLEDLTEEELYGLAGTDTPMKKAFQLLKGIDEYDNPRVDDERMGREAIFNPQKHPGDMNRHGGSDGFSQAYGYGYLPNMVERDGEFKERHPDFDQWVRNEDKRTGYEGFDEGISAHLLPYIASANSEVEFIERLIEADEFHDYDAPYPYFPSDSRTDEHTFQGLPYNEETGFTRSEPMDIAFQLLKERKSPAAFAHKLEYDKQYQKDPKRVKYREQLNSERRKRGIYGKGGKDVSHTQGGKLTLESAHSNRARHFKNKGTLRRVKVKK